MVWGDVGTFILKAGSLSGLAALLWQGWREYDERRRRLRVETTRYGDNGMTVLVSYRPRSHHIGLKAVMTMLEPSTARCAGLTRVEGFATVRMSIEQAIQQLGASKTTEARLFHLGNDPQDLFTGEFFVTDTGRDPPAARVKIEVWTTGYPRRVASRRLKLSPID